MVLPVCSNDIRNLAFGSFPAQLNDFAQFCTRDEYKCKCQCKYKNATEYHFLPSNIVVMAIATHSPGSTPVKSGPKLTPLVTGGTRFQSPFKKNNVVVIARPAMSTCKCLFRAPRQDYERCVVCQYAASLNIENKIVLLTRTYSCVYYRAPGCYFALLDRNSLKKHGHRQSRCLSGRL